MDNLPAEFGDLGPDPFGGAAATDAFSDDAQERIVARMLAARTRADSQMKALDIKSRLAQQAAREKTAALAEKILGFRDSDPELFSYIFKLEQINSQIWCEKCETVMSVSGRPDHELAQDDPASWPGLTVPVGKRASVDSAGPQPTMAKLSIDRNWQMDILDESSDDEKPMPERLFDEDGNYIDAAAGGKTDAATIDYYINLTNQASKLAAECLTKLEVADRRVARLEEILLK